MSGRRFPFSVVAILIALSVGGARAGEPSNAPKAGPSVAKTPPVTAVRPAPELTRTPRSLSEALRILDAKRISVRFEETRLEDALLHLSDLLGMNLVIGAELRKEGGADLRLNFDLKEVTGRDVLSLAARGHDLGILFSRGVLQVTTRKAALGKPVLRLYSVAHLTFTLRDFPAPDLMLRPAGSEPEVEEPRETKGAFGDADEILELLKGHTGDGTWADDGVSASVMRDVLVVRQYPGVHREIGALLSRLSR